MWRRTSCFHWIWIIQHSTSLCRPDLPQTCPADMFIRITLTRQNLLNTCRSGQQALWFPPLRIWQNSWLPIFKNGRYGDNRIRQEETTQQMHTCLFTSDLRVDGMAYGFYEINLKNPRVIGHEVIPACSMVGWWLYLKASLDFLYPTMNRIVIQLSKIWWRPLWTIISPCRISRESEPGSDFKKNASLLPVATFQQEVSIQIWKFRHSFSGNKDICRPEWYSRNFIVIPGIKRMVEVEPLTFSPADNLPPHDKPIFGKNR